MINSAQVEPNGKLRITFSNPQSIPIIVRANIQIIYGNNFGFMPTAMQLGIRPGGSAIFEQRSPLPGLSLSGATLKVAFSPRLYP